MNDGKVSALQGFLCGNRALLFCICVSLYLHIVCCIICTVLFYYFSVLNLF